MWCDIKHAIYTVLSYITLQVRTTFFCIFIFLLSGRWAVSDDSKIVLFSPSVHDFYTFLQHRGLNNENCVAVLRKTNIELFAEETLKGIDRRAVRENSSELIKTLFLIRIELRHVFGELMRGPLNSDCVSEVRNSLRNVRVLEEYLGEWVFNFVPTPVALKGNFPGLMLNPAFQEFTLKNGDLILSRGNALSSSMISRFGEVDGLFSHLSILYINKRTNKKYVIQAEADGVMATPLEEYARDGKLRAVVLRQTDPALADRAANYMYRRVKKASASGENIPYDFTMRTDDDSQMYCAEVPYVAYKEASGRRFFMGPFQTKFTKQSDQFLNSLGVLVREAFTPVDILLDPRFEIVADWRNLAVTSDARMKDAVYSKLFEWMHRDHFEFEPKLDHLIGQDLAWLARRWPVFGRMLKDRFPKHMQASVIGLYFVINEIGESLNNILNDLSIESALTTGYPLTMSQALTDLDLILASDRIRQKNWQEWNEENDNFPELTSPEPDPPIILTGFHP